MFDLYLVGCLLGCLLFLDFLHWRWIYLRCSISCHLFELCSLFLYHSLCNLVLRRQLHWRIFRHCFLVVLHHHLCCLENHILLKLVRCFLYFYGWNSSLWMCYLVIFFGMLLLCFDLILLENWVFCWQECFCFLERRLLQHHHHLRKKNMWLVLLHFLDFTGISIF